MAKHKTKSSAARDKKTTKPAAFPPLYRANAVAALHQGLRAAYARRGRDVGAADIIFARLTANLRVLRQLHAASQKILTGDRAARVELRANLDDLGSRHPGFHGSGKGFGGSMSPPYSLERQ